MVPALSMWRELSLCIIEKIGRGVLNSLRQSFANVTLREFLFLLVELRECLVDVLDGDRVNRHFLPPLARRFALQKENMMADKSRVSVLLGAFDDVGLVHPPGFSDFDAVTAVTDLKEAFAGFVSHVVAFCPTLAEDQVVVKFGDNVAVNPFGAAVNIEGSISHV